MVPKKKNGNVNGMTTQIEVKGNKKFYDINRNNINRGDVDRRIKKEQKILRHKSKQR